MNILRIIYCCNRLWSRQEKLLMNVMSSFLLSRRKFSMSWSLLVVPILVENILISVLSTTLRRNSNAKTKVTLFLMLFQFSIIPCCPSSPHCLKMCQALSSAAQTSIELDFYTSLTRTHFIKLCQVVFGSSLDPV